MRKYSAQISTNFGRW